MATRKLAEANHTPNPTLPFTEIEILGKTYKMCLNFRAMARADAWLREQGVVSNMVRMLPNMTFEAIPIVLAASLATFHPELKFADVVGLVDYDNVWEIRDKLYDAWVAAFPTRGKDEAKDKGNPPKPDPS